MWAVQLTPSGASYTGTKEEFLSGSPLPITDAIINPNDGAMYFAIGGRRVQSGTVSCNVCRQRIYGFGFVGEFKHRDHS